VKCVAFFLGYHSTSGITDNISIPQEVAYQRFNWVPSKGNSHNIKLPCNKSWKVTVFRSKNTLKGLGWIQNWWQMVLRVDR
jgi:hypothetical protein